MLSVSKALHAGLTAAGLVALVAATPAQALDKSGSYVYVPNRASADVAVIDSATDTVVARVAVGNVPHQVVVSDTLGRMVASNTADDTISIIDLETMRTAATVTLGASPEHMELSPGGDVLAVGNIGAGTVSLVSLAEGRETARIDGLHEPHNLTFSPDGKLLYIGNLGADFVSVIDVAKAEVVNEIPVGDPKAMASTAAGGEYQGIINVTRTPDGRYGFAAYGEGDRMAVIDLHSQETVKSLALGDLPWRAYSTADGRFMIVPNNGDRTVSIVSTATLEEVARLDGAEDMTGVNTGWFETTAFVISRAEDKVVILDLETMTNAGEIALGGSPETGVITPDGTKLYIALSGADAVAVIDVKARKLIKTIAGVGKEPWGAHMVGALNYCH
ncbi:MAG: beta-propeller fold lactonase family protein [Rhodospirillaceae bacterium]|jgi:YVTN family beta-propeller protein|nr:beta-propeller fold lactonase family protein [Rhodospirillaceae bacterium]MBT6119017.1 beta-propeller fold lactonase family protein [Rhodospirillaceae bacterium]